MSTKKVCCSVCFEDYGEADHAPRVLGCGHTVCTMCLHSIITAHNEVPKCPECRVRITSNRATNYPINYTVLQMINTHSGANSVQREITSIVAQLNNMKDRVGKKLSELKLIKENNKSNILVLKSQMESLVEEQSMLDSKILELVKWLDDLTVKEERVKREEGQGEARETLKMMDEALVTELSSSIAHLISKQLEDDHSSGTAKCKVFACHGEGTSRRWAKIIMQGTSRLIHALSVTPPPPGSRTLQFQKVCKPISCETCLAFIDLWWEKQIQGRVFLRMFTDSPRARQFLLMCSGEMGPSYKGTRFSASHVGEPGEVIFGGTYSSNNRITGVSILPNISDDDLGTRMCTAGLVWVLPISSPAYSTIFCVTLRSMPGKLFSGVLGEIVSGLAVLRAALQHRPIEDIAVKDCGLIFTL